MQGSLPQSTSTPEKLPNRKKRFDDAKKEDIDPETWGKITSALKEGFGLYIFGKVGTGKTHLCYVLKKEYHFIFRHQLVCLPELFLRIKGTFGNKGMSESEKDIIDEISGDLSEDSRLLIIDDIGTEKPTDWAQETLFLIIDRRYRECRPTVFTSNLSLDELSERMGERITSRIAEMCKVIELKGKDRRIK